MRELQLWDGALGLTAAFEDVEVLGAGCRFGNCLHHTEPGCAVKRAVEDGTLDAGRLASYRLLHRERAWMASRVDEKASQDRKRNEKMIGKLARDFKPRE
jgi:ribosome biogenesis GTPase